MALKNISTFMSKHSPAELFHLMGLYWIFDCGLSEAVHMHLLHVTVVLFCSLQVYGIQYTVFTSFAYIYKAQDFPFVYLLFTSASGAVHNSKQVVL